MGCRINGLSELRPDPFFTYSSTSPDYFDNLLHRAHMIFFLSRKVTLHGYPAQATFPLIETSACDMGLKHVNLINYSQSQLNVSLCLKCIFVCLHVLVNLYQYFYSCKTQDYLENKTGILLFCNNIPTKYVSSK